MEDSSKRRAGRPRLLYPSLVGEGRTETELPFTILVLGDYTLRVDERPLEDRRPIRVDRENFERVLAEQRVELNLVVADRLSQEVGAEMAHDLKFKRLSDFTPVGVANQVPEMRKLLELRRALTSLFGPLQNNLAFVKQVSRALSDENDRCVLLHELGLGGEAHSASEAEAQRKKAEALPPVFERLLAAAKCQPDQDGFDTVKKGLQHFIGELLAPNRYQERIDLAPAEAMLAEIDARLSAQINEVLHHPDFQRLESAWRALKYLIDRADPRENVRVELLPCSKEDLGNDFEDSPEIVKSGLHRLVTAGERGVFRGEPVGLILADYEFGPDPMDIALLHKVSAVAASAHAVFVSAASPRMFGLDDWQGLPRLKDLMALFEGPKYARWHAFRESEDARHVGLCLPQFLLRPPYGEGSATAHDFRSEEDVIDRHDRYLWGNAAFLFAARAAASFARCGLPSEVVGLQGGGYIEALPRHQYDWLGARCTRIPTGVDVSMRMELALAEQGLIGLVFHEASGGAVFLSARSCHKVKYTRYEPVDTQRDVNQRAARRLPDALLTSRVAQYIEVMRFERRRDGASYDTFARDLVAWLDTLAGEPPETPGASRPFRAAAVVDISSDGPSGWWRCEVELTPRETCEEKPFSLVVRC